MSVTKNIISAFDFRFITIIDSVSNLALSKCSEHPSWKDEWRSETSSHLTPFQGEKSHLGKWKICCSETHAGSTKVSICLSVGVSKEHQPASHQPKSSLFPYLHSSTMISPLHQQWLKGPGCFVMVGNKLIWFPPAYRNSPLNRQRIV